MKLQNTDFVDERSIRVSKDATLQVKMTDAFLAQVRRQFALKDEQPVTDDYVKMYILHATKNALSKINQDNGKDEQASLL